MLCLFVGELVTGGCGGGGAEGGGTGEEHDGAGFWAADARGEGDWVEGVVGEGDVDAVFCALHIGG